jgi:hypothetical protein
MAKFKVGKLMKYFTIILVILGFSSNICFAEKYISKTPPSNELIETNINMIFKKFENAKDKQAINVAGKHEVNKDTYRIDYYWANSNGGQRVGSSPIMLFKLDSDTWILSIRSGERVYMDAIKNNDGPGPARQ